MNQEFIETLKKQFTYYKQLGEKSMEQLSEEQLFLAFNEESNSIAIIVKHLSGNMLSRWTDFWTSDGEKPWRNRESEFDNDIKNRTELLDRWERGWACLFLVLNSLQSQDLERIVYIRNQGHTAADALLRQLAHYPYHIGQMVYIAKMCSNQNWKSLSIPRGQSQQYNQDKFQQPKQQTHFTDEFLNNKK